MRKQPARKTHALNVLLSLMLLVQGVMPAGYMPASLDSGWLVMLCPDGLPDGFLLDAADTSAVAHQHHHHAAAGHLTDPVPVSQAGDHHHPTDASATDYCPLGSALNAAEIVASPAASLDEARTPERWLPVVEEKSASLRVYIPHSRGPPVS